MSKKKSDKTKIQNKKHKDNPAKDEPLTIIFPKQFEAENEREIEDRHGVNEKKFLSFRFGVIFFLVVIAWYLLIDYLSGYLN